MQRKQDEVTYWMKLTALVSAWLLKCFMRVFLEAEDAEHSYTREEAASQLSPKPPAPCQRNESLWFVW